MGIAFFFIMAIVVISVTAIVSENRKAIVIAQMKMQGKEDPQIQASLNALREEIRSLRDTSMQYDMSFDTALQKIDQRVVSMERRMNQIEEGKTERLTIGK